NEVRKDTGLPVEIITVSRTHNKNVSAQKGLFVMERKLVPPPTQALEERLAAIGKHTVRQFCLPTSEGNALLDLLRKLGVDRAHLMPSFDGVVAELKARQNPHPPPVPGI